jgi:transcriptional regulator with XRE-family HTH domain
MFGDNLKQARERCGISQVKFAELIGVSQPMVAQYELNTKIPSVIIAVNMEKVLNVSCRELVEGKEQPNE